MAEMAAAAFAAGVRYFGASGHSHTPSPDDVGGVLPDDLTEYRETALRLRERYQGQMEVLLGLEWDSCSDADVPPKLDFWIGSVHNLHDPETGRYYAVDWKTEVLAACCIEQFHGDFPALIRQYYAAAAAVAAKKPTILGHFDLITKFNGDGGLFDEDDRLYRAAALSALHAADPKETLLEINTGAVARGYRTTPYPAPFLLREWKRMGGRVILTSDAHSADAVVFGYRQAAELAEAEGFSESVLLTGDGPISCPL
jgi:histidinol-phosphatase (PHP family)